MPCSHQGLREWPQVHHWAASLPTWFHTERGSQKTGPAKQTKGTTPAAALWCFDPTSQAVPLSAEQRFAAQGRAITCLRTTCMPTWVLTGVNCLHARFSGVLRCPQMGLALISALACFGRSRLHDLTEAQQAALKCGKDF